jgi:hypothetical protein
MSQDRPLAITNGHLGGLIAHFDRQRLLNGGLAT